ncbi:unnamed protein product [Rangifer tarandus platyrhynchus]|uniref:Uncharacterized protein n=1 Tax=Rangifer tarandus platyrhynchus TaxID=3082113 RepID=A0ABN8XJF0_RANTA|nr:unnamed protein product [Rangifer tarandus platyrhynchus]
MHPSMFRSALSQSLEWATSIELGEPRRRKPAPWGASPSDELKRTITGVHQSRCHGLRIIQAIIRRAVSSVRAASGVVYYVVRSPAEPPHRTRMRSEAGSAAQQLRSASPDQQNQPLLVSVACSRQASAYGFNCTAYIPPLLVLPSPNTFRRPRPSSADLRHDAHVRAKEQKRTRIYTLFAMVYALSAA